MVLVELESQFNYSNKFTILARVLTFDIGPNTEDKTNW